MSFLHTLSPLRCHPTASQKKLSRTFLLTADRVEDTWSHPGDTASQHTALAGRNPLGKSVYGRFHIVPG